MKNTGSKFMLKSASLMMAILLMISFSGCSSNDKKTQILKLPTNSVKDIQPEIIRSDLHATNTGKLTYIAKSGLIEMLLDKQTYSIAIKETLSGDIWYSLPVLGKDGNVKYDNSAAAITLSVVRGSDTIYMNSQDNSVAFGKASYKVLLNEKAPVGISVTYIFTTDAATAKKAKYSSDDIAFAVTVIYKMDDGSLNVSCSTKNISGNTNAKIEYLGLLEFLGASDKADTGDFILVPDGCGALIRTDIEQKDFKPLEFDIYGRDVSSSDLPDGNVALVAAYGIKKGKSGLAVIIEQGDKIGKITADRSTGKSGFNKVGAKFNITPVSMKAKGSKGLRYISAESFTDDLKLCLRFVTGSNATYSGIASVCREQLIRNNVLSTKTVESSDNLPFNLTVAGAVRKKLFGAGPIKMMATLTTFEQTRDILFRLKSKGINNIYLRYKGALTGGLNQADISDADFLRSLGGMSGFAELSNYMATQKMQLYLDINLLKSGKNIFFYESKAASTIFGDHAIASIQNEFSGYLGDKKLTGRLRLISSLDKLDNVVFKILTKFKSLNISGFCLNDAGKLLYSDYSHNEYNREAAAAVVAKQITSLSTGRKIMMDTGNFSAIKNADVLVNMPLSSSTLSKSDSVLENNPAYQEIPFIQMILHGIVDYSGTPINEAYDPEYPEQMEKLMLRYIEYGACPSYEFCYTELKKGTENKDTFYYENWIDEDLVDFYTKANGTLLDLRGSRMLKHYKVAEGVFCTEYEGNSLVYVNYTKKDFKVNEVGGVTVKAENFIRVN